MVFRVMSDGLAYIKRDYLTRQRNFFAMLCGLLVVANCAVALKLATSSERLIMVPGINTQMEIEGTRVSRSYLEETALLYISALLDLSPSTSQIKKEMVLRNTSKRNKEGVKALQEYFAESVLEHKKFNLFTSFAPKKLHVDAGKMQVIVEGILTTMFGQKARSEEEVKYKMNFDFEGGKLLLSEFIKIKTQEKSEKNTEKNTEEKLDRGSDEI